VKNAGLRIWLLRLIRGLGCLLIVLILFVAGTWTYANWSGSRHWKSVQALYAREGETFDLRAVVPDPIPDDQNYCAIPALKDLPLWTESDDPHSPLARKIARLNAAALPDGLHGSDKQRIAGETISRRLDRQLEPLAKSAYTPPPGFLNGAASGQPVDLAAWAAWLRKDGTLAMPSPAGSPALDLLAGLAKNNPLIAEFAAGLDRPEAQWTPPWKTRTLPEPYTADYRPYEFAIQKLQVMLCLRAVAAARAGDAATAHQSLLIALRLNQANMGEPFFYGALISCGNTFLISDTVWELCESQSGSVANFQRMQEQLEKLNYQKSFLYSARSEVTASVDIMNYLRKYGLLSALDSVWYSKLGVNPPMPRIHLIPNGWYEGNTATIAEWYLDYYIKPLREGGFGEMLSRQRQLWTIISNEQRRPIYDRVGDVMAGMALSTVQGVTYRVIYAQSQVNEAIAACALERYRLEHGNYPDTLQAANHPGEGSIPLDFITGKPMGYRRTSNGRYILWCVSLSGIDHGGKRMLSATNLPASKLASPDYTGDWVWDYPAR
jgi:hypothetical protein